MITAKKKKSLIRTSIKMVTENKNKNKHDKNKQIIIPNSKM